MAQCVYERYYIILHVINLSLKKITFFPITDICELISNISSFKSTELYQHCSQANSKDVCKCKLDQRRLFGILLIMYAGGYLFLYQSAYETLESDWTKISRGSAVRDSPRLCCTSWHPRRTALLTDAPWYKSREEE